MFRFVSSKPFVIAAGIASLALLFSVPLSALAVDTGYQSPTGQAPGPGGDGNGFEISPTNAFADDGLFAGDIDSGTVGSLNCTDPVRDNQDFFNYGLAVPSGSAINGIEVRLDAKVDLVKNSAALCVQLSADGGASWTAAKTTPALTTSEATYLLGGSADTWGRSWTTSDLSNANFRVRVTTIANATVRDFYLDWAAVKVTYGGSATATNTPSGPTTTPTSTPTSTSTPLPTHTSTPGASPTPTATSTPTSTPTKTNTPSPTNTPGSGANPITIYGAWHCGNDACTWSTVRDMTNFDYNNHWLIDRGDGSNLPSVNLVILAFVDPLKLLNKTNDSQTTNGIPIGMNQAIVDYFKSHGIRVMLSIGGITYTDNWDTALGTDSVSSTTATQLGLNAAAVAKQMGVGIEIDYERSSGPKLQALQAFINAYRSQLPYDTSGANQAARLTIDVAAGDRWLIDLDRYATANWLTSANPVLDYANAMVPRSQPSTDQWQEHIDGKPNYSPPILPLAPAKLVGSLWLHGDNAECTDFSTSHQNSYASYVETVAPNGAGTTNGMLGYMFWAAECPSSRATCTTPPNTCEGGMGAAARIFNIPIPMPALRQQ